MSKGGQGPVDKDPLALRPQAIIAFAFVPVMLVALAVGGASWCHYLLFLAAVVGIWAIVFRFAPWWFDWVRGSSD